jgi:hypothetical protein
VAAARARLETKAPVEMMSRSEMKALVETRAMEPLHAPETRTRSRPAGDEGEGEAARAPEPRMRATSDARDEGEGVALVGSRG